MHKMLDGQLVMMNRRCTIMEENEAVIIDTENVQELRDCTEEVSE